MEHFYMSGTKTERTLAANLQNFLETCRADLNKQRELFYLVLD